MGYHNLHPRAGGRRFFACRLLLPQNSADKRFLSVQRWTKPSKISRNVAGRYCKEPYDRETSGVVLGRVSAHLFEHSQIRFQKNFHASFVRKRTSTYTAGFEGRRGCFAAPACVFRKWLFQRLCSSQNTRKLREQGCFPHLSPRGHQKKQRWHSTNQIQSSLTNFFRLTFSARKSIINWF